MEDIFEEYGYDPDGYGSDPYIEGLLSEICYEPPSQPKKKHRYSIEPRATDDSVVDARIKANYKGRLSRCGPYRSRRAKLRVLCDACDTEFIQTAESLFRSAYTRCRCSRQDQLPTIPAKNE